MNNYTDSSILAALFQGLATSLICLFLSYRLAVFGKQESAIPYWKSVVMIIFGNMWAQGTYTLWQPSSMVAKIAKYTTITVLLIPSAFIWTMFAIFLAGFFDGLLFGYELTPRHLEIFSLGVFFLSFFAILGFLR